MSLKLFTKSQDSVKWEESSNIPDLYMKDLRVEKIADYLYNIHYLNYDYADGDAYYEKYKPTAGACSSVNVGNFFGRSYDWYYDERNEFVVHTYANNGKHATIGIAEAPTALTTQIINSGEYDENYKVIPFLLLDGINDAGLVCNTNVCPTGDKGRTTGTNSEGEDMFAMMIPRYVLDYASSVDEAIELIRSKNIFCAFGDEFNQEFHIMISDLNKTVVVEFVENEVVVIDSFVDNKEVMTNFYLDGYDGTKASLTSYAMGVERYNLLAGYADKSIIKTEQDMLELVEKVKYTKSYITSTNPYWYTEFVGDWRPTYPNLTIDSPISDFAGIVADGVQHYLNRTRNGVTWQSVHQSVYNKTERKVIIVPQESGKIYTFKLGQETRTYEDSKIRNDDTVNISWDGNTTGRDRIEVQVGEEEDIEIYIKVSDQILYDKVRDWGKYGYFTQYEDNYNYSGYFTYHINGDSISVADNLIWNINFISAKMGEYDNFTVPSTGTYFKIQPEYNLYVSNLFYQIKEAEYKKCLTFEDNTIKYSFRKPDQIVGYYEDMDGINLPLVKITDRILSKNDIVGATYINDQGISTTIQESDLNYDDSGVAINVEDLYIIPASGTYWDTDEEQEYSYKWYFYEPGLYARTVFELQMGGKRIFQGDVDVTDEIADIINGMAMEASY